MRKIPTVFRRDPKDMRRLLPEVNPGCEWVLAGEGVGTRKYDGTCVMVDSRELWWARREVKPSKAIPPHFLPISTDETTGKTVGWEPIADSGFAKWHAEALRFAEINGETPLPVGTYELCGPKVQGNPEGYEQHILVRHADAEVVLSSGGRYTFEALRDLVVRYCTTGREGIVWHHADGRQAKLKGRDF